MAQGGARFNRFDCERIVPLFEQDEHWLIHNNEVMAFIAKNHRRPLNHRDEKRGKRSWYRHLKLEEKRERINR